MGRSGFSASQKRDLWERWKRGQSLNDIARALAKRRGSIHHVLSSSGGIEPSTRRRSRLALSLSEREEISRGLAEGQVDAGDRILDPARSVHGESRDWTSSRSRAILSEQS